VALGMAALVATMLFSDMTAMEKMAAILGAAGTGYFLPNFILSRRIKKLQQENRSGFPDVMDLMIVAAEAGLTLEASIDRIAREIEKTYPTLSRQLSLAAIEIRAGRPLDQALRAFGERLGIDEVQGFATMIQQSKELGTSVSDALRVYSEEMRHKRMMVAEERAYALPAKLSIPVTAFILPVVIGIAVLPTVVRMMNQ
jgi:tight adherence protein C